VVVEVVMVLDGTPLDVARLLASTPPLRELLHEVAALRLPQGCIAAGMVRNAVWDALHERAPCLHASSDVDVIYFDPERLDCEHETRLEALLSERRPDIQWQVRNQARMAERNGDPPYLGACDATRYYPETATAISARLSDDEIIVEAPLGLADLFALIVRPTPNFAQRPAAYRARLASKDWAETWPRLRFVDPW
jgi:uncharacterized protein